MNEEELRLLESSKKIGDSWHRSEGKIQDLIEESSIKETAKACYILVNHSDIIFDAILCSLSNNNLLASCILFRSLTEYFLRLLYIYLRAQNDGNDSVGYEYNILIRENEYRQFNNSVSELNGYIKDLNVSINPEILKPIKNDIPVDNIKKAKSNFTYRNIIKYIFANYSKVIIEGPDELFFYSVMQEYLELSSFIHGGPTSFEIFVSESNKDDCKSISKFIADRSLKICNIQKFYAVNLLMKYQLALSLPNAEILLELINQFNKEE